MAIFTNNELNSLRGLVVHARGSIVLQKKFGIGYVEAESIVAKIDTLLRETKPLPLNEFEKDIYDISYDDVMIIKDTQNNIEYRIDSDLVHSGKIAGYLIEDRDEAINNIESWLSESKSESDKYLMREDLEYLRESSEDYVFTYYGTNGFIAKDVDMPEFNKVCQELIESFNSNKNVGNKN